MWSLRYKDMAGFIRDALEFGFTHLELNSSLTPERLKDLLDIGEMPVSSVHAPCPNVQTAEGIASSLSLSTLDEDERREAIRASKASIDLAARVGAEVVIIHAGYARMKMDMERELRRLYEGGHASGRETETIRTRLMQMRELLAGPNVDAAKENLLELAVHARGQGVRLALENRVNYNEIPSLDEMMDILGEFSPVEMGCWYDVGHAEIQARTGFTPAGDWLGALADRMIGAHLHDLRGLSDHHAPGAGDLDWDSLAENLPPDVIRVCEIADWNEYDDARRVVPFLQGAGII